jgi:hypothetical protein
VKKRNWIGIRWFVLYKVDNEIVDHIFVYCPLSKTVWKEVFHITNGNIKWAKHSLITCFENWILNKFEFIIELYLIFLYGDCG